MNEGKRCVAGDAATSSGDVHSRIEHILELDARFRLRNEQRLRRGSCFLAPSKIEPRHTPQSMRGTTMGNQAPGSEQTQKSPSQGTNTPGSQDKTPGQREQSGRQTQPAGSQPKERDRAPGVNQDKENDRSKSGSQRPD
jgi:hypothetical protein